MLFFKNSKFDKHNSDENNYRYLDENPLFKFFHERNKEELARMANELTVDARDLFESNLVGLLGYLPEDAVHMSVTMNKDSLQQLLYSSMMTGYMAKSIENKLQLEKLWNDEYRSEKRNHDIDTELKRISKDDLDQIGF